MQKPICILADLPMPPSDNSLYLNIRGRGRVKAPSYRVYESEMNAWLYSNLELVRGFRVSVKAAKKLGIQLHCYFPESKIFCKDGRVKRLDVQNRGKAVIDLIFKMLESDDSKLFAVYFEKRVDSRAYINAELFLF